MASSFQRIVTESEPVNVQPLPKGKSGALLATYRDGTKAVLKSSKKRMPSGRKTQRGLLVRSQPNREVAFYQLSQLFKKLSHQLDPKNPDPGFDFVPETVLTQYKDKEASAQLFMPAKCLHDFEPKLKKSAGKPAWRKLLVKTSAMVPKRYWRQLLALDIVSGSRDRHANNIGVQLKIKSERPVYRLVAWDNATSFGQTFEKYHNVFHKSIFRKSVPFDDVWRVLNKVTHDDLLKTLSPFLSAEDIDHAYLRTRFFLDYPYRLPWKVCSLGHDDSNEFPSYADYFENADEDAPLAHAA